MRPMFGFAALLLSLLTLTGCGERHAWRQKIILEVETPQGLVSGGSVVEISVSHFGGLERAMSSNEMSSSRRGEASFVEIAPGRYMFALTLEQGAGHAEKLFRLSREEESSAVSARLEAARETRTLSPDLYPRLVTFSDVNDPKSVKLVDPANLAAAFGPGFALKSVKLELTDEKVKEGVIERILVWLGPYPEPGLCEPVKNVPLPDCRKVHQGDFIRR